MIGGFATGLSLPPQEEGCQILILFIAFQFMLVGYEKANKLSFKNVAVGSRSPLVLSAYHFFMYFTCHEAVVCKIIAASGVQSLLRLGVH